MRRLLNALRRFDPSFLVTLAVLGVLGVSLWLFVNVAHDVTTNTPNSPWIRFVNGDSNPMNNTTTVATRVLPVASRTPTLTIIASSVTPTIAETQTISPTGQSTSTSVPSTPTIVMQFGTIGNSNDAVISIYEQPNRNSPVLRTMNNGERVQILQSVQGEAIDAQAAEWYQVRYQNLTGYIYGQYIELVP